MRRRELYICTKPLQYFNARNIVDPASNSYKILLIKDSFIDAQSFITALREQEQIWDEVYYACGSKEYYRYILKAKAQTLYIDNDSSGFLAVYSTLLHKSVYVYEEGYGTYRRSAIKDSIGKKKFLSYKMLGIRDRIGNGRFVKGVYVYLPDLYRSLFPDYRKEIKTFNQPFLDALADNMSLFLSISTGADSLQAIKDKTILIYLTSHCINETVVGYIKAEKDLYDRIYIKPHPHIKNIDMKEIQGVEVMHSNLMFEILLLLLLRNNNKITVVHENSTAVIWFQSLVKIINMGAELPDYELVSSYIRNFKV